MKKVIFSFGIILLSLMLGMPLPEGGGQASRITPAISSLSLGEN